MSRGAWGITLRLAGPVVQVLGLVAMLAPGVESVTLPGGLPLHRLGVVAFLGGLLLVVIGLALSIWSRARPGPDHAGGPIRPG